jgi:hypothetical protein
MGYLNAAAMIAQTNLEDAVAWHLRHNCFPPMPGLAPMAMAALALVDDEMDDTVTVTMPEGWTSTVYGKEVPVYAVITQLHLEAFRDAVLERQYLGEEDEDA